MPAVRTPASSVIISIIFIPTVISVLTSILVSIVASVIVPTIVRVTIKLTIPLSASRDPTLAPMQTSILFESANINEETPDFVALPSVRSSSPKTNRTRADGLVSAHDMADRLSLSSARFISDVTHCPTERFREVSSTVDGSSVVVAQLMSCDREFGHGVLAHPLLRKVRRDEAVEDEVAVSARPIY
jgi:hypothetical protein